MADMTYCTQPQTLKARKEHRCTWCGESILKDEQYKRWASFDDCAFTNKMHLECDEALYEEISGSWDWEYIPFDNERPTKSTDEHTQEHP